MKIVPKIERTSFSNKIDMIYLTRTKALMTGCTFLLYELKRYIESRAIFIKKVVKNPLVNDYRLSVEDYDDMNALSLGRWFSTLKKEYMLVSNIFAVCLTLVLIHFQGSILTFM